MGKLDSRVMYVCLHGAAERVLALSWGVSKRKLKLEKGHGCQSADEYLWRTRGAAPSVGLGSGAGGRPGAVCEPRVRTTR